MTMLLGIVTVVASAVTFWDALPYLFGMPLFADLIGSTVILSMYAGTAAVSGLTIAVFAILAWTLFIRIGRFFFGYKRVSVNGETSYSALLSGSLTTTFKWVRSSIFGLFVAGKHKRPNVGSWTVEAVPGLVQRLFRMV